MKKRKKYLIDRDFQLKHTFSVLGVLVAITLVIIALVGVSVFLNNQRLDEIQSKNDVIMKDLDKLMPVQDNIVETLMAWSINPAKKPPRSTVKELAQVHYKNIASIKSDILNTQNNIETINRIIKYYKGLLFFIIIIVVVLVVALYVYMIRKTHKISGPIFVMSRYFREIIEGKTPTVRPIRSDDEFQEFYNLFTQMVNSLKAKHK